MLVDGSWLDLVSWAMALGRTDKEETGHRVEDSKKAAAQEGHGDLWVGLGGGSAQVSTLQRALSRSYWEPIGVGDSFLGTALPSWASCGFRPITQHRSP